MNERAKITASHLSRQAFVYLRQSSAAQVENNRESTDRQYALAAKARELGWPADRIVVIDEDLGLSGSGFVARSGFARLTAEVALAHVGLVLGLEVSRLARNNADWHRLIELGGLTDTLIGDADGIYHPALFNDRLLLGLKGAMSEAELHVLRARLNGGIRNKAARGELRRGLPVGFVWGEADGEVRFHPDEAVIAAIRNVFASFAQTGSARRVWLWFRSEGLTFPLQMHQGAEIRWVEASYTAIHHVLTNPVYAGAYAYGKSRRETMLNASGVRGKRVRKLPRSEWQVLIPDHHPGFIDWPTYEANQDRIAQNTRPGPHKVGGAVREGSALLQGLATCGHCGRRSSPGYHCPGKILVEGRGVYCLDIGGIQIDEAVTRAFIAALEPAKLAATVAAAERLERSRPPRPSFHAAKRRVHGRSPRMSAVVCSRSELTWPPFGMPQPRRRATGRSCCGRCSRKSLSKSSATRPPGASPSAGRAARPLRLIWRCRAHGRPRYSCAGWRPSIPTP